MSLIKKLAYPKLGGGEGDLCGGERDIGDLDLDLEELRLLLLFLDRRRLGLRDLERRSLCDGGDGERLVYRRFGGEGLFSIGMLTGLGLFDISLNPIAI